MIQLEKQTRLTKAKKKSLALLCVRLRHEQEPTLN